MSDALIPSDFFALPCHDRRLKKLPDTSIDLLCQRLSAMAEIARAPKKAAAIKAIAGARRGEPGWGETTIRNLWYELLRTSDWYVLVNKTKAGKTFWSNSPDALPEAFLEYIAAQWSMRQRDKFRAAWVDLKDRYRLWALGDDSAAIPGYQKCPPADPRTGLPAGWSQTNLHRRAKKYASRYDRKLIQIGPKAAHNEYTYKIPTTREGIAVGQIYDFDDQENDFRVLYRGRGSRILSLHAHDLASDCVFISGHKPMIEGEFKKEKLKEHDMIFLVAATFSIFGYRPDGTWCVVEKSTATIRPPEEEMLARLSGDAIRVSRGPVGGGMGVAGLFAERSGGNPRWKPIEGWFNLLRNRCDHMLEFPGQLGSNSRINCPEGTALMEKTDEAVARAAQLLTPERQQQIRYNGLQYENARPILDARIEFCNTRRDHDIGGWRECGHYVPAFRVAPGQPLFPFTVINKLRPEDQEHLRILLASDPSLVGEIQMTPREVFDAGRPALKRFTPQQTAIFLRQARGQERPVKRGILEYECPEIDPYKPLTFGPTIRDCQGGEWQMGSDDKFDTIVNTFAPDRAWLYDAKGVWVGMAQARWETGTRLDEAALQQHFKAKSKQVSAWTAEARKLAAPISQRADEIASNNAAVINDQQREETAMDRKLDRRAKASEHDFSELGGTPKPDAQEETTEPGISLDEAMKML